MGSRSRIIRSVGLWPNAAVAEDALWLRSLGGTPTLHTPLSAAVGGCAFAGNGGIPGPPAGTRKKARRPGGRRAFLNASKAPRSTPTAEH